jgi:hypothetical protein
MPLTQPERDNPLMRRYFREIGLPGKQLAKRCDVSHSQTYMARKRNVGANNAEKISRRVALILGLSEQEKLELKAENHGDNLLPGALFGGRLYHRGRYEVLSQKNRSPPTPSPRSPRSSVREPRGPNTPNQNPSLSPNLSSSARGPIRG